jgi:hypothetical protein
MLYLYSAYIKITIRRRRRRKGADGGENRIRSSFCESTRIADIRATERARITEKTAEGLRASSTASSRRSVTSINLNEVAPAPTEHKEIAGVQIALQRLLHLQGRPFIPRRMSVWPVAIHTPHSGGDGNHRRGRGHSSPPPPGQPQANAAFNLQLDQRHGYRRRGWLSATPPAQVRRSQQA